MGCLEDDISPIAVIGVSGRFPGAATNPDKLWEMCAAGQDAWSPIPSERFNSGAFYHPDGGRNGLVNPVDSEERDENAHISSPMSVGDSF